MLIRLLRERLLPYRGLLVAVVGLQAAQSMCTLYLPSITADIIDKGVIAGDRGYIWARGGLMLGVTVVQMVFYIAAVYFGAKAAMSFGRDVRHALFHRVTAFSAREVAHHGAPSLITRITNDVQQVQMFVLMGCTLFVSAPITAIGGIVMATREDAPLSMILLVSVPALVVPVGIVVSRMIPQFRTVQDRIDRVNQVLREQITGIRVVRAFVREPDETARFEAVNDELTEASLHASHLMAFMFPTVMIVLNVSSIAAVWFGGARIDSGDMKVGALVAFISYLVQILVSVMMATFMVVMAPRAAVSAERVHEVLDTEPTVKDPDEATVRSCPGGALELRGVGFHYPGAEQPVLCDVSFVAEPGTTTAIIGSTGAGKTTLLNVIPRLYDVTSGSVTIGGVDVREMATEDLWNRIGLVPQKPYLFSGTVRSNLLFAAPDAEDEDLWAALTVAQAEEFVRALPDGLDSTVNQGGTNLSGGQRQRLAIARALVRRPDVYLFDDTFSALDLTTDARLRAALVPWTREAAVVIVAQRVSTITSANQIVVLDDGRVVGLGTHASLLESCPTYQEIVESQVQERGDAA